jgi:hypothetical protein
MVFQNNLLLGSAAQADDYTAKAVAFNNSPYLTKGSAWTGGASTSTAIISFWIKMTGGDGVLQYIFTDQELTTWVTWITRTTGNKIRFTLQNTSGGAQGADITSATSITADGDWHHVLLARNGSTLYLYIDGSSDSYSTSYLTSDTTGWTRSPIIAARTGPTGVLRADLFDFYIHIEAYLDISNSTNREKFRDDSGKPVYLGANGELPTGSTPIAFHHVDENGSASDFVTNLGTGGGMTLNGTLSLSGTSPTD